MKRRKKPNVVSRAFRLLFCGVILYMFFAGSTISWTYNGEKAKKTFMDHLKKVVSVVKIVKPIFG